jgi:predicted nuclease of predicted toxin-antitoxin system
MAQAPDGWIWQHAARVGSAIITKDEDFAQMTVLRPEPVAVVWLRLGNCRTPDLLRKMEQSWPEIIRQIEAGARLMEVQ